MRAGQEWKTLDVVIVVSTTLVGLVGGVAVFNSVDAEAGDLFFLTWLCPFLGCGLGLALVDRLMSRRTRGTVCPTCGVKITTPECPVCGDARVEPKATSIEEFLGDG